MKAIIKPSKLQGTVNIIPSKSHAHRLLIAAYLAGCPECVDINLKSDDILATKNSLEALLSEGGKGPKVLDCNESGSTLRFLLPVAKVLEQDVTFLRSGRLPERPLAPLDKEMRSHGCSFVTNESSKALHVRGKMKGGDFWIPGNISSQFITGLLFALPLTEEGGTIRVEKPLESRPYIDLTMAVLKQFSIEVTEDEGERFVNYTVSGGQKYTPYLKQYREPGAMKVEGDWSSGAFWVVANALGANINVEGLSAGAVQGDKAIIDIVTDFLNKREAFATIEPSSPEDTREEASRMTPVIMDARHTPDLVPIVAVLACGLGVKTEIINAERLKAKESDRLSTLELNLTKMGYNVGATADGLHISPAPLVYENDPGDRESLHRVVSPVEVDSYNDHRIAMSLAIASLFYPKPIIIKDCQAVTKSYPGFFEDFRRLGGNVVFERD